MPTWILYALLSMVFAGLTSVIAKFGLANAPSDVALTVRTSAVFGFVWLNAVLGGQLRQLGRLTRADLWVLVASGLTTTVSWVFYYRAIQTGQVSTVAVIDKGSVVLTIVLAWLLLGEPLTPKLAAGAGLVVAGLLVLVWK